MFELETPYQAEGAPSAQSPTTRRLGLLQLSQLSRQPAAAAVCANCSAQLPRDFDFGLSVELCRKCLGLYARLDSILNAAGESKANAARLIQFAKKATV